MLTHWRAYYTEGRQFDSVDCDWCRLPDDGVLAVATTDQAIYGFDWYFLADGISHPIANNDSRAANRARYDAYGFKRGRWAEYDDYHAAKTAAQTYARGDS